MVTRKWSDMEHSKIVAGVKVPVDLDMNGFQSGLHYPQNNNFRIDRIKAARKIICVYLDKMKTIQKATGSYGLKHRVESALGDHLSNGELIVAMIGEGFSFERDKINCFFNVTAKSVSKVSEVRPVSEMP